MHIYPQPLEAALKPPNATGPPGAQGSETLRDPAAEGKAPGQSPHSPQGTLGAVLPSLKAASGPGPTPLRALPQPLTAATAALRSWPVSGPVAMRRRHPRGRYQGEASIFASVTAGVTLQGDKKQKAGIYYY